MGGLKSFFAALQEHITLEDKTWSYHVPNLPSPQKTNPENLVKIVSCSASKPSITLRFVGAPSNRVTWAEPLDRLILLSVEGFRLESQLLENGGKPQTSTARESAEYISRLLKAGLSLNGTQYYFFGHSNSQLKSRSCFLYGASKTEISKKIEAMGDFSKMKSVAKKAKRIGLLFSSAEMGVTLSPDRCEDIEDVQRGDYNFTDGCGLISKNLAKKLVKRRTIAFRNKRYLPSVFQIRYRGYKGVLTLDPTLDGKIAAQFRSSMRKFQSATDLTLSVVDYSKPYAFGFLNDEVTLLLHSLGVSTATLLEKQDNYLEFLQSVHRGSLRETFRFLGFCNRLDVAEKLLLDGFPANRPTIQSLVKQEHAKMLNKRDEQRCRILIPNSRLLFGICDPTAKHGQSGLIKEGCCFVRITHDEDGQAKTLKNAEVLVTRNPCLHPGDLQKFRVVDIPEFSHLVDCIVFPTLGRRPSADLMSGGDLDGDKFFVTWDEDIVPRIISQPAEYPGVKEPLTFKPITDDDRADYFAKYTNASLGRVKNLYLKWARLKGSQSSECQQLNRLFSQCVDGNRIKVPQTLEDPPEPIASSEPFILDTLHTAATQKIMTATDNYVDLDDYPVDTLDLLLSRDSTAVSEFELIQLTLRWCDRHKTDFRDLMPFFDFSQLSDEQQAWLLNRLPAYAEVPSLIRNGLLQSQLVDPAELRRFKLDHARMRWRPIFSSSTDRMGRFFDTVSRSLELFHKKLIILRVDERLTLAMYIPRRIERAAEVQVDDSVRVFALPRSKGNESPAYCVAPTKLNYRLYCDGSNFWLYQGKRGNTWVFLTRGPVNATTYQHVEDKGARRKAKHQTIEQGINFDCRASVALDKINKGIQTHVGRLNRAGILDAEIYVISNRDTESLRVLDLWLHYVDTQETLPLFEQTKVEYTVPQLKKLPLDQLPSVVAQIVRNRDSSKAQELRSLEDIQQVLELLLECGEKVLLRDVYAQALSIQADNSYAFDRTQLTYCLLEFLPNAPFLTDLFLESTPWQLYKEDMKSRFVSIANTLLAELVLSANSMQTFIRSPFRMVLQELNLISVQNLASIIELIALSIRDAETALDLLLEVIEPETSRLLVGQPRATTLCAKCLIGIALDHIDEVSKARKTVGESLHLTKDGESDGFAAVQALIRVDSPLSKLLKTGDHIRLTASSPPQNAPLLKPFVMDAVVIKSEQGAASFRCIHRPPPYVEDCVWSVTHCGSFVTTKTMFDALSTFYTEKALSCRLFGPLVGLESASAIQDFDTALQHTPHPNLNESQNRALEATMKNSLTFLWGPPGTGKTHTIVVVLTQLLKALPENRVLVAAPTHNAVDNILQKFIDEKGMEATGVRPLRVSTNLSKVSSTLRSYTCDAMVGKDLTTNNAARKQAEKRVRESRLIFTTCIGAGLGLLRPEKFEVVLVDEASQQTEPETLVPLSKGCQRAVLVGDHVQLRATVQKTAVVVGLDVSLFERHYNMPERPGVAKAMLDMQYRMHRDICAFSSAEFYEGRLQTAVPDAARPLARSQFPWPGEARKVFVPCTSPEDIGQQSKCNRGQAEMCRKVCELLRTPAMSEASPQHGSAYQASQIAVLTPYTRQKELLQSLLPMHEVSSIDGYQGREADIIVFVTVRCNVHYELGFLNDMRRLNVAMTRAKTGVVVIGDRATLTTAAVDESQADSKGCWRRLLRQCREVDVEKQ